MLPDPEALIRRSGAAAPLLNAIRERRDRDSVSVRDRAPDRWNAALRYYSNQQSNDGPRPNVRKAPITG